MTTFPRACPVSMSRSAPAVAEMLAAVAGAYPNLAAVQRELVASGSDYADEFEAGLDIILAALPEPGIGE